MEADTTRIVKLSFVASFLTSNSKDENRFLLVFLLLFISICMGSENNDKTKGEGNRREVLMENRTEENVKEKGQSGRGSRK